MAHDYCCYTRNACGHHSRVWNKQNAIQPAIPISPAGEWITLPTDSMRAYFDLCIIKYFLNVISPNNDMQSKLTWLFIRFPEIDLKALAAFRRDGKRNHYGGNNMWNGY